MMDRRRLLQHVGASATLALAASALRHGRLRAAQATPTTGLAGLGLPEVTIAVDDAGFTAPSGVTAGRVLMTVRNTGSKELHFFAARVPDEISDEQLATDMKAEGDPAWFDMTKLTLLGSPDWPPPGGQARGVVDLVAGRWLLVDPIDNREVALMTVGESDARTFPDPAADVTVSLIEMDLTGLEQPIPAGERVWRIQNDGALDHELAVIAVPAGATRESVMQTVGDLLQGKGDPASFAPLGGQGAASKGVASWQSLSLAPGTYAALCMAPMPGEDFTPHAMKGMVTVFTVR
jgi:hypothetical protein